MTHHRHTQAVEDRQVALDYGRAPAGRRPSLPDDLWLCGLLRAHVWRVDDLGGDVRVLDHRQMEVSLSRVARVIRRHWGRTQRRRAIR